MNSLIANPHAHLPRRALELGVAFRVGRDGLGPVAGHVAEGLVRRGPVCIVFVPASPVLITTASCAGCSASPVHVQPMHGG